jgi:hypothetical protein
MHHKPCGSRKLFGPDKRSPRRTARPWLELLEDRCVPAAHIGLNTFPTIQAAVDAASAGNTITVDAGIYTEKVTINKSVILEGAQHGVIADSRSGPESIVTGIDAGNGVSTPFYVTANNVTIDGFTVEGATSSNQFGFGILLGAGTSGSHVLNNIVQDNIVGLALANNGGSDQTVIQHNLFQNNNQPGPASGDAIYTDQYVAGGKLTNVLIDANTFVGNDGAGIDFSSTYAAQAAANITITNNLFVSNGRGLVAFNMTGSAVQNNSFLDSTSAAAADIDLREGVAGLTVTNNLLELGAGRAMHVTNSGTGAADASDITFALNFIGGYTGPADTVAVDNDVGTMNASGNCWWDTDIGPNPSDGAAPMGIEGVTSGSIHIGSFLNYCANSADVGFTPDVYYDEMWVPQTAATTDLSRVSGVIQEGIDTAVPGMNVRVAADTYAENVVINKDGISLLGAQSGVDANSRFADFSSTDNGPKVGATNETVLTTPTVNPTAGNPGANDLIRVLADNVAIDGLVIDGNNPDLDQTSAITGAGAVPVDARRGITNVDSDGVIHAVNNLVIQNNIIQNVAQRGISLDNNGLVGTGNLITGNVIHNFGSDPDNGGEGIILFRNAYADITNNTIIDDVGGQIGIQLQNFYTDGAHPSIDGYMIWSGNDVTVGQDGIGIHANLFYAENGLLVIQNNTVNAAADVTGDDDKTWGINVWSVQVGSTVSLMDNTVGSSGGEFARGINLWNLPTTNPVTISGGSVANSVVGINLDSVDPYFGAGAETTVNVSGVTVTGGTTGVQVRAVPVTQFSTAADAVPPTASVTLNLTDSTISNATTGILVQGSSSAVTATIELTKNTITGNDTGVDVEDNGQLTSMTQNTVTDNTGDGVLIGAGAGKIGPIQSNYFGGNVNAGLENQAAFEVDATYNDWGDPSGPTSPANPGGTGDAIIGSVAFEPWATS